MNKDIQALLKMVMESEELQAEFEKLETPDAAYELASKLQQGFTKEEFLEVVNGFAGANDDITDEQLAAVAGGEGVADIDISGLLSDTEKTMITTGVDTNRITKRNNEEPLSEVVPSSSELPRKAATI